MTTDPMYLPPQSMDVERVVLGTIMSDETAIDRARGLTSDSFYFPVHKMIFEAIESCVRSRIPVDCLTVTSELQKREQLLNIGGASVLAELVESGLSVARIEHHAKRLIELALARSVISACQQSAQLLLAGEIDPADALDYHERIVHGLRGNTTGETMQSMWELIPQVFNEIETANRSGGTIGLTTGFTELDEMTTGFHPGDLVIVAGRPGRGKSAFALAIALHNATKSTPVPSVVFSLEMGRSSMAMRMLAADAGVEIQVMRSGQIKKTDQNHLEDRAVPLRAAPVWIDDDPRVTVAQIASRARAIQGKRGLGCIIVDYIGLMHEPGKHESRHREVSQISAGLKGVAKELGVPVIALNQLGRECETREPHLADLKDSGSLEQDADAVIFLHWPWRLDKSEPQNLMKVSVGKQRNGPIGALDLTWEPAFTRFSNMAKEYQKNQESHDVGIDDDEYEEF